MGRVAATPASTSTFSFSSRGTRLVIYPSSFVRRSSTMARYRVIRSFFTSSSRWIYPTISWESLLISNLITTNIRARSSPANMASYFTSLLEVGKLSSPMGDYKTKPTPDLDTLDVLPTSSIHHCYPGELTGYVCFLKSSVIKSVITCLFKYKHDWYLILYSTRLPTSTSTRIGLDSARWLEAVDL